jgi:isopentenyldiphosphate isomerase
MKVYPPVVTVNEHDEVVGTAMLADVPATGLAYRVVFAILENAGGQVLLQRRAAGMKLFPGCWDASAGGHVDQGFDYDSAIAQELQEEIGVSGVELHEAAHFYTEALEEGVLQRYWTKIYCGRLDQLPQALGSDEVSEVRWFTVDEVVTMVRDQPEMVADGLLHVWNRVLSVTAKGKTG